MYEPMNISQPHESSPSSTNESRVVDVVDPELLRPPAPAREPDLTTSHIPMIDSSSFNPAWGYELNMLSHAASHLASESQQQVLEPLREPPMIQQPPPAVATYPDKTVADSFGNETSIFEQGDLGDPLQDFNGFLESVGISSDWHTRLFSTFESEPQPQRSPSRLESQNSFRDPLGPKANGDFLGDTKSGILEEPTSFSRFGSRLPSLQPEPRESNDRGAPGDEKARSVWEVAVGDYQTFLNKLHDFKSVLAKDFSAPSRASLSRYFSGYVNGFHEHLPFIHMSTLSAARLAPELTLALAAIGAQYRYEHDRATALYFAAKAVAFEQIKNRDGNWSPPISWNINSTSSVGPHGFGPRDQANHVFRKPYEVSDVFGRSAPSSLEQMDTIRTLLLLTAFGTWEKNRQLLRDTLSFQSILARLVREQDLVQKPSTNVDDMSWEDWVQYEGDKRTKLIVYCFFNLHSIVWNVPPLILNSEMKLNLPGPVDEWKASNAKHWHRIRRSNIGGETSFQEAFSKMFAKPHVQPLKTTSPLGNYILIHAIIQQIFFARQLCSSWPSATGSSLRTEDLTTLQHALNAWKNGWKRSPESSIDPQSPNGPIAFTSTALLGLAYIRLHVDLGPIRHLEARDPDAIAHALIDSPPLPRSPKLIMALLHSAHALSIPVRLGVNFVAKTHSFFWSIQHSLCSLECAFLLSKWLASIPSTQAENPLSDHEHKLLNWVRNILDETEDAVPDDFIPHPHHHHDGMLGAPGGRMHLAFEEDPVKVRKLSIAVVRVWAKTFKGNSGWAIVDLVGSSLAAYAELLADGMGGS